FNPSTSIEFNLPETAETSLKVYSLNGELVATLVNGMMSSGAHNVNFDASALTSGMYFYTLESKGVSQTRKMVLVK
ncbi:MAG: T9SS type A sorting domain-containing protein, partial [Candidatus Cloacimonetes bacterium]|nr:T9SS type A sorting domain-containing protein [Candidatus Cloacimonadota bacterium]